MEPIKVYSTMPYEQTLEVLSKEGFEPTKRKGREFLWLFPSAKAEILGWDPYEWFSASAERRFLVHPESIIPLKDEPDVARKYQFADNFDYRDIVQYHNLTHKLPNSVITTADESVLEFLGKMPGKENPFLKVIKALDNSAVLYEGELYPGSELEMWAKKGLEIKVLSHK